MNMKMSRPGGTFSLRASINTFVTVSTTRLPINEFLSRAANALIIDVRSPGEYDHAHMPGAINLPLFTNEERKVVGTAYKQDSREQAIKIGLDYFGPKMRVMVEEVEKLLTVKQATASQASIGERPEQKGEVLIYCWRGGMRSAAVGWLLNLYGFRVDVLAGGYKSYRHHVLQVLSLPFQLTVLGGYTGSGKTSVLHQLKNRGVNVVDLEGLACHKGSAFGGLGMPAQPSQEMFENRLALELESLHRDGRSIWIEDESQRIGLVNIPGTFWTTLRRAPICFLDIPFEERLEQILEEYGSFDKEILANAIQRISKRLGGLETKNAHQHLTDDNLRECFRILLSYYDKHYLKGLHNRESLPSLLTTIACSKVDPGNAERLLKIQPA
jgi:tRNA 2-selenouridine synthase